MKKLISFLKDEDGVDMAEYALLLGIITVAIAAVITTFGSAISTSITNASGVIK